MKHILFAERNGEDENGEIVIRDFLYDGEAIDWHMEVLHPQDRKITVYIIYSSMKEYFILNGPENELAVELAVKAYIDKYDNDLKLKTMFNDIIKGETIVTFGVAVDIAYTHMPKGYTLYVSALNDGGLNRTEAFIKDQSGGQVTPACIGAPNRAPISAINYLLFMRFSKEK